LTDFSTSRKLLDFDRVDDLDEIKHVQGYASQGFSGEGFDVIWREHLSVSALNYTDTAALAGTYLTQENLERERRIEILLNLVRRLATTGISLDCTRFTRISLDARDAALAFIQHLDAKAHLPMVAPDGEGGLIFFWRSHQGTTAVVVEGSRLHMVLNSTAPNSEHIENIYYGLNDIPDVIYSAIPRG
jgi:hypothetical protein